MSATITVCERNGAAPGKATEKISNINWKAVDDVTTSFTNYRAVIGLGSNSYVKYNYLKFAGNFTTLGNVRIKHYSGTLPSGVKLVTSPSITNDGQKLAYSTPVRAKDTEHTTNDFTGVGSYVDLLIGAANTSDPANSTNKLRICSNAGSALYTNYFVSQLQVSSNASIGDVGPVVLEITYDEV